MSEYLLLLAPSANRVYADAAPRLAAAEAGAVLGALVGQVEVETRVIAGVPYLVVRVPEDERVPGVLARLSATFAAYLPEGDLLRPLELPEVRRYPDDLVTIQKYAGKTNEQWTRLCLNVTAAMTAWPARLLDGSLRVLDPLCGRGTTLNLALLHGLEVTGVDIDRKDYEAYAAFIKTWAREHRFKHQVEQKALTVAGRTRGRQLTLEIAPDKAAFKAGHTDRLRYVSTDATDLDGVLRPTSIDVIVTDTPYGVQHGSHGDRLARSPLGLLDRSLPSWTRVLRTGGAIGLSYNRHVAPVEELHELVEQHGLTVCEIPDVRHRVDASIDRDLLVARKA
ncbi:SAM-dependent methyltransferase [Calidifontibacter sp. DB0510]|uniref:SAM-dependent methyltransferase n=1 Tax=Metallococcus carri TaxID=1656884 RepID=A0A967EFT1_9MICO|nr:SAM-dependent methyltransferase [Metallococcus carri]NHN54273.1 SAM-dependent methyltransferase [Metallococcus carri]NOP36887.1 SAM-dependent methyltransferase [Calidifontibacter sp. DB2511S]